MNEISEIDAINDGQIERGHVATCDGCGCEGVFCDTDAGGIVDGEGREIFVELGGREVLLVGKRDGTCTDNLYCEDCA